MGMVIGHGDGIEHGYGIGHGDGDRAWEHSTLSTPIDKIECASIDLPSENGARTNPQATYILIPLSGQKNSRLYFVVTGKQFCPHTRQVMQLVMIDTSFENLIIYKYL